MITDLKPYPTMVESGVSWLGTVPEHWEATSVKRHYNIRLGKMLQNRPIGPEDVEVHYLKAQNVQWFSVHMSDTPRMWASPKEISRYGVAVGDLLVCEGGEGGRAGIVRQLLDVHIIQNALHRVRAYQHSCNDFLQYVMSTISATGWFDAINNKATIAHFTREKFSTLGIPVPPYPEQAAIVRFLDYIDHRIRRYIRAKKKLITLLEEYKQAIINQAVTKGLDPNVKMKPSGIEWLGEIPEHWIALRTKFLVDIKTSGIQMGPFGASLKDLPEHDTGFKVFGQENTISSDFERGTRWIEPERFYSLQKYSLEPGDVVLTRKGSIGQCRLVPVGIQTGIIDSDTIRVRTDEDQILRDFFVLLLHSADYVQNQILATRRGAILAGLNTTTISNITLVVPALDEQHRILCYIGESQKHVEDLVLGITNIVDLIKKLRIRLVSGVVTGKVDVRDIAAQLPEEEGEEELLEEYDEQIEEHENVEEIEELEI